MSLSKRENGGSAEPNKAELQTLSWKIKGFMKEKRPTKKTLQLKLYNMESTNCGDIHGLPVLHNP